MIMKGVCNGTLFRIEKILFCFVAEKIRYADKIPYLELWLGKGHCFDLSVNILDLSSYFFLSTGSQNVCFREKM